MQACGAHSHVVGYLRFRDKDRHYLSLRSLCFIGCAEVADFRSRGMQKLIQFAAVDGVAELSQGLEFDHADSLARQVILLADLR